MGGIKVSKPFVTMDGRKIHQSELIGMVVGRLTILEVIGGDGRPGYAWCRCICSCGKEKMMKRSFIVRRVYISCGCASRTGVKARNVRKLEGQRFGRLVAIERQGKKRGCYAWRCRCDCGNETVVRSSHLSSGATRSCGCLAKETLDSHRGKHVLRGRKNPRWNPNIKDHERIDRRLLFEATHWRKAVFERDGYACVLCGEVGGRLHAHHLEPWATAPELRFDVDNGATLCVKHHKEFHFVMGKKCTRRDFEIYRDRWYRKEMAA